MRTPRAVNSLIDDLFERKYRKVGQEKNALGFFSRRVFCFNIVTPGKGSKYLEFYDLSGRITCMLEGGTKVCMNGSGLMTKMAATPIYGEKPSKLFFSRTRSLILLKH